MKNAEEDVQLLTSGKDTGDMYYKTITGLKDALTKVQLSSANKEEQPDENPIEESSLSQAGGQHDKSDVESGSETDGEEDHSSESGGDSSSETGKKASLDKKAARKENKKKVKEEKREARKTKVPKAVKKRKKKLAKAHKTR